MIRVRDSQCSDITPLPLTFKVMEDRRSAVAAVCGGVGGYGMEAASRLPLRSSPKAFTAKGLIMGPLKLHFGSF